MKIIKLTAENIKKLRAVEIVPDGPVIKISGRNAQGKTTVLDAIWWALGGTKSIAEEPIRLGETKGSIRLELDDLIVTRTFTPGNSYLKVENRQGAAFKSPQAVLDSLIGRLSFDPLAFARADAKTQRDLLLQVTALDVDHAALHAIAGTETAIGGANAIDTINGYYKEVFDARTVVNRQLDAAKKVWASLPDVPATEPVSVSDLMDQYRQAQAVMAEAAQHDNARRHFEERIGQCDTRIAELERELAATRETRQRMVESLEAWEPMDRPDLAAIEAQLANAETINQQAQAYHERVKQGSQVAALQAEVDALTDRLEAIKTYKDGLMAEAQFPVDGLGFSTHGVTYHGVPFDQASSAEKLQVSLAMAMALNPTLRVIRVDDASLLDQEHLALIEAMARDHDYQIWMEVVDDSGTVGIYIEDGEAFDTHAIHEA